MFKWLFHGFVSISALSVRFLTKRFIGEYDQTIGKQEVDWPCQIRAGQVFIFVIRMVLSNHSLLGFCLLGCTKNYNLTVSVYKWLIQLTQKFPSTSADNIQSWIIFFI